MEKKIIESPAERLKMLAQEFGIATMHLGEKLGYNNNSVVDSIVYGRTASITPAFAKKAIEKCPEINYLFLTKGELPVFTVDHTIKQLQQNLIGTDVDILGNQQIIAKLDVIAKTQIRILKELEEIRKNK